MEKIADLNVQEDPSNPDQENKDNSSDPNQKKDDKKKNNKKDKNKKDKKDKNKKNNKVQTPGKDVDKESKYESDLSGGTSKVDSSTGLKDGSYVPDKFSWSGGTGKVQISCSKVSITGGQAYATITFSSDAYGYVKANGNMYYPDHSGGGSTFVIPVALNKNNSIIGMTTRMSVPHEIQYSIFVYLNGADNKSDKDKENPSSSDSMVSTGNKKLDDKAPEITGLEYKDETTLEHAKHLKVYHYENDITLLEVDMTTDTARTKESVQAEGEANTEETAAGNEETAAVSEDEETAAVASDEEQSMAAAPEEESGSSAPAESTGDKIEQLYMGNVIKYLIVPEDADVPAGLDKDVILIRKPVEKTYVDSANAAEAMDKLGLTDKISMIGSDLTDLPEALSSAVEAGTLESTGTYTDLDYKTMLKSQCTLAILPSDILPKTEEDLDAKTEELRSTAQRFALLEIPFIVDRSSDEENDEAVAEWEEVYKTIFDVK